MRKVLVFNSITPEYLSGGYFKIGWLGKVELFTELDAEFKSGQLFDGFYLDFGIKVIQDLLQRKRCRIVQTRHRLTPKSLLPIYRPDA